MPRLIETRNRPHPAAIRRLFWYDHETGEVGRYRSDGSRGKPHKAKRSDGYLRVFLRVNKKKFEMRAHHVAYCMVTGQWPVGEVDHIDGDKTNNSWRNLRLASRSMNEWNKASAGVSANHRQWQAGQSKHGTHRLFSQFCEAIQYARTIRYQAMKSEVEKLKAASVERSIKTLGLERNSRSA